VPAIYVRRNESESNESLVRRFVRKVQASGNLLLVKKKQHRQRPVSKRLQRRSAILRTASRAKREHLRKIGKLDQLQDRKRKPRR
jgi:ribosomal protein S21